MDAATMRQGAALVRALLAGDNSARLPLSDWITEWRVPGHPWHSARAIDVLRSPWPLRLSVVGCGPRGDLCPQVFWQRWDNGDHWSWACWLGVWPAWAWDGPVVVSEVLSEQP